jgi:CO/xanthine dehydrogenase Mo-binding subunit
MTAVTRPQQAPEGERLHGWNDTQAGACAVMKGDGAAAPIPADRPAIGRSMPRPATRRLVSGRGRYVDDITVKGELQAAFLRSPYPHAAFTIEVAEAAALEGVVGVLTADDLDPVCRSWRCVSRSFPGMISPEQRPLAKDHVVYQGEPLAIVVAHSRSVAEDAVELIAVRWEELPAVGSIDGALAPDGPTAHVGLKGNLSWQSEVRSGDPERAFTQAALVVRERLVFARKTGVPLEPRSVLASYDPSVGSLLVHIAHQMPHQIQAHLADLLELSPLDVRVVCSDVGGAFGIKMHVYPDEIAVCAASKLLGRPVKFIADRFESMLSDVHAREHIVDARMAVDASGRILAFDVDDVQGLGAYSVFPRASIPEATSMLRAVGGPYRFDHYHAALRCVLQNKSMIGQYRSVGHPIACAITERLVDLAARARNEDAIAFRRRNFLHRDAMPWISPTGARMIDLSHAECLERLIELADIAQLRADLDVERAKGRIVGFGLASFVEFTATGAEGYGRAGVPVSAVDTVVVTLEPSGHVRAQCSACEIGQGIEQGVAQVLAGAIGVSPERVRVFLGDTAAVAHGGGAWSSRGAAITGEAAWGAGRKLRAALLSVAAALLQVSVDALDIRDNRVVERATGAARLGLDDIGRTATFHGYDLPGGSLPQLTASHQYGREADPFLPTNGIQASLVEIDPATGIVTVRSHWVVEDCGRIINPLLVDEQIRGGVVQGIGEALYEACRYDEAGQFVSGTLADYLVPMAAEMPDIVVGHVETPYSGSILGAKGAGEAGTCGAPGAILNAVNDALAPHGGLVNEFPITPMAILRALGLLREDELS